MFDQIKDFFGIRRTRARVYCRSIATCMKGGFTSYVQNAACALRSVTGWMRVVQKPMYDYIEMEVEASKYKIKKFIANLRKGH